MCKIFILCEVTGGAFEKNSETTEIGYFAPDALPENLANEKTTAEQIRLCFVAAGTPRKAGIFRLIPSEEEQTGTFVGYHTKFMKYALQKHKTLL